jgi:DNA-binding Xre family transcriptional regulator
MYSRCNGIMPINTKWFRARLSDREMSQRELARRMGLDSAAVSLMLRGQRQMKLTEAAEIARLLGVPAEEVMANAGVRLGAGGAQVQIAGTMDGHGEVSWTTGLGKVPMPGAVSATKAIQCRTAGTPLDYMDRWLLFVGSPSDGVQPEAMERLSLVKIRKGMTSIAQVRRGYQAGRWNLSGPVAAITDVDLEWATPVVLIQT